ncbi:hypothetical protein [uncultured Flavonifractor sp.]|uniref:hypothetical protein n=1 Tax=uncultured Flavonifractor sp. TaxID=1193534 RepID=UPI002599D173|nr:hypothetical protein [uncultured Flavonifractor sp.]
MEKKLQGPDGRLCRRCRKAIVLPAFSTGRCTICGEGIVSSHTPCDKVCMDCARERKLCAHCGRPLG